MILTTKGHNKDNYGSLLNRFQPQVINSENEYKKALELVEQLMHAPDRTPDEDKLFDLWVVLIEKYEDEHYPVENAAPHQVLQHLMEENGLKQADLVGVIGSSGVVSEIYNCKRKINTEHAKKLGSFFHVPPAVFI